ncbi:hypothetical protein [Candidatus Ichthyocystis sparus]|nr:hypothetical protein [Candidatus Ichthyocystis sparus]
MNSDDFSSCLDDLCGYFPIVSIEYGMAEDDWSSWQLLTKSLGDRL